MKLALTAAAGLAVAGAAALPEGDPQRGERAYMKCYGCHSLEAGRSANGPSLHNIVGKPIASDPADPSSEALRRLAQAQARWTPELLDRFVADPEAVAPGTDMGFFVRTDVQERADLIAYLGRPGD